jgi:hypothetical protein
MKVLNRKDNLAAIMRSSTYPVSQTLRLCQGAARAPITRRNLPRPTARHYSSATSTSIETKNIDGALKGVKILDLSRVLAVRYLEP